MAYTTINKPSDYFNTKLYTGDGSSSNAITGVGFQPDFTWIKSRVAAHDHLLQDAVRGVLKTLNSNNNSTDDTISNGLTAFGSDGFTVGGNGSFNSNTDTYASWNWKANGAGSANTDGSISSTVSANTTSGFSIVSYTGTGANATVGHGLGSAPSMIIVKNLNSAYEWGVYHKSLGATQNIYLDSTGVAGSATFWNNTEPTSSVFNVGSTLYTNGSGQNYIAYCFADVQGFSKFGSYTGNGNVDGTFVYTGFKPAFVMVKGASVSGDWYIKDNKRSGTAALQDFGQMNPNQTQYPAANSTNVENKTSAFATDILSNGFKIRGTDALINFDSGVYIYMAFAEAPLVGTNGVTAKAR